jgi:hypothetical protein
MSADSPVMAATQTAREASGDNPGLLVPRVPLQRGDNFSNSIPRKSPGLPAPFFNTGDGGQIPSL